MMRCCLALCMICCLLLPGFLSAQERWLRGKVVSIGEHEQKKPEVNITVTMLETGDADNTNSLGLFRIFLKSIFKPGEKVTLVIDKPSWHMLLDFPECSRNETFRNGSAMVAETHFSPSYVLVFKELKFPQSAIP